MDPQFLRIVETTTSKFRELQRDRAARLNSIFRLTANEMERTSRQAWVQEQVERRIAELERAADERLQALLATDAAAKQMEARAAILEQAAAERLEALLATDAAFRQLQEDAGRRLAVAEHTAEERLEAARASDEALRDTNHALLRELSELRNRSRLRRLRDILKI
jgi:hypothetical protein